MLNESRPIKVRADNTELSDDIRVRVRGSTSMTLLPDLFTVDLYNISSVDLASLGDAKMLYVFTDDTALICCGEIEDIHIHQSDANTIYTVLIVDGKTFHNMKVSMSISGGSSLHGALHTLLGDNLLGGYLADDLRFPRGQTFSGFVADYVSTMAKTVNARAFFSQGAVYITEKGKARNFLTIDEENVIGDVDEAEGTLILRTKMKGYPVGTILNFRQHDYRLVMQAYDADNSQGFWRSVLTLVDEAKLSAYGMEGG